MRLALLLLLCGCKQLLGFEDLAPDDAGKPSDGAAVCVGSARSLTGALCLANISPPRLLEGVLDTNGPCDSSRNDLCVVAAQSIEIATLRVRGPRPLVLWSASTILVRESAVLDVRSSDGLGPGANDASCPTTDGAFDQGSTPLIGTGGCGGPFASAGGNGGDGRAAADSTVSIECSDSTVRLERVQGGCRGGAGGLGAVVGASNGGSSAGGIYLMAATSITIAGAIDARGMPGQGGPGIQEAFVGGGGGGSGGLIGLDAPSVFLDDAVLNALGGGGGGGSGLAGGGAIAGIDGKDANLDPPTDALGGPSTVNLNFGGTTGEAGGSVAQDQTGGGGGGGGGDGYIVVVGDVTTGSARIEPPLRSL